MQFLYGKSYSSKALLSTTLLSLGALSLTACAHAQQTEPVVSHETPADASTAVSPPPPAVNIPTDTQPVTPPVNIPPLPDLKEADAKKEAIRLQSLMVKSIKRFTKYTPERREKFINLAQEEIKSANITISRPQLVMVVDRNERVQHLDYVLALPDATWVSLGGTPVSTGSTGRKYYYITPTGVFQNTIDRLGYRAEGTKNKYGIRGIGAKGSRVWDMGWQTAMKGWLPKHETGQIRLEIHATDPQFLEGRLGHPASEGCIRIPATMNHFMDHYGLIDVLYEQAASYDRRFSALLPKDRQPTPIAGDLVVVIDSGPLTEPKIDPIANKRPLP
ncbi:L,D-transpeptidase [Swingsia samuiensis]|uniref:L,D-transpeptidase n=1 Tax=Swingsia samuiensis TaxID=1293412 RepID=A0A4Y6UHD0_9PROT|nr:L,D-transpeptidase [Swingsia samuiensis]QDH16912.1 L,D-transpeptidase [Swingsia samuiensis]